MAGSDPNELWDGNQRYEFMNIAQNFHFGLKMRNRLIKSSRPLITLIVKSSPLNSKPLVLHQMWTQPNRLDMPLSATLKNIETHFATIAIWIVGCVLLLTNQSVSVGDELILDESMTESQVVGDFDVQPCSHPIRIDEGLFLDEHGEIVAGKLWSMLNKQGIDSTYRLNFAIDLDPSIDRADYQFNSIELEIEGANSDGRLFSLGAQNSLMLPGYETSNLRPEAQVAIQLDYDFMKRFNEHSTEKIKFQYTVDGEKMAVPVKIGIVSQNTNYSPSRMFFLMAFAGFWAIVFSVLFRVTSPKPRNAASPA